jgi:hypothetical protein
MVVDSERFNSRFREGYNKLRVIDIASKVPTWYAVGPAPETISDREEGAAVWSPDGRKVAFIGDSVLKVIPMNPDGSPAGPAVQITNHSSDMPSWAADSETILYMNNGQLKKIRADGSHVELVPLNLKYKPHLGKGTTVIHAGKLWNGLSENTIENVDIIIKGARISRIEPHSATNANRADKFVDASNLTVIPGLWDSHYHPVNVYSGSQFNLVWAAMFAYGFTSVQSVAGAVYPSTELREAIEAGNLVGPRLLTSSQLLEGNRSSYSFARNVRNPDVADLECTKYKALDIDWVKSYVRAPIPVMNRLARCAQEMGVPSATHLLYPGTSTGIQGLSHMQATQRMGYGFAKSPTGVSYQDVTSLLGEADMHLMETLGSGGLVAGAVSDPRFKRRDDLISNERFNVLMPAPYVNGILGQQPRTDAQLATLKIATDDDARSIASGALFSLGTDVPLNAPGTTNHTSLQQLTLSISNFEAMKSVTIGAAQMSFKDNDLGSIEVGKLADIVIVEGNPLEDVKYAAYTKYVIKNGIVYTLDQIMAPFKTTAQIAARHQAIKLFEEACKSNPENCQAHPVDGD